MGSVRWAIAVLAAAAAILITPAGAAGAPVVHGENAAGKRLAGPSVGEALVRHVKVRSRPRLGSRRIAWMSQFRFDNRPTVFYVWRSRRNIHGNTWYRISVPGRPNGRKGWVRGDDLRIRRSVGSLRIVVDRSKKRLRLRRGSNTIFSARVAVGRPEAPTPLGRFYVTAAFKPDDPFLGEWAFETSAYSSITDWPRGGIVGLHGTNEPQSIGRRVSSGCVRVRNSVIKRLKRSVRPGTPIRVKR